MSHLLTLKKDHFVLWRPLSEIAPQLTIGVLQPGNPCTLVESRTYELERHAEFGDLWILPLSRIPTLREGGVYHYFFKVQDTNPYKPNHLPIEITDPMAYTVDWRLRAPVAGPGYSDDDRDPSAVIMYAGGALTPCDAGGETAQWNEDAAPLTALAPNNMAVIYELPTSWAREGEKGGKLVDVGSFQDVLSLVERDAPPANFAGIEALEHRSHLQELGINVLELNPPADSFVDRQWGYATSNYFAADWDLGKPFGHLWSTATADLVALISACHRHGIRFFVDMAMGFSNHSPLQNLNFTDFLVRETNNSAEIDPEKDDRKNWGGDLLKYGYQVRGYDPISGAERQIHPARQFMQTQLAHWMTFYHIDGVRMDSIKTIYNWDFVEEFSRSGREYWRNPCRSLGLGQEDADRRFYVVGEIIDDHEELELVRQKRADGVWNESFKRRVRQAILGRPLHRDAGFEETVKKMIDSRRLGYSDLSQVVNYLGSHDVEGAANERLYDFLENNGIWEKEKRIKLAFVCLLTAVGIPMILAGDEFADQHDLKQTHPEKQMDAVNYERLAEPWRRRIFDYTARLVKLRTSAEALGANDTEFFHSDFHGGRQVMAWLRGIRGSGSQVVVVANFSNWSSQASSGRPAEYIVPNWPDLPAGKTWWEVSQNRMVPDNWAGREPLFPWEAKVYAVR